MGAKRKLHQTKKNRASRRLIVRLDEDSKACLERAAELRGMSVSNYVRTLIAGQARRELRQDCEGIISMTPEEQLAFWNALNETPKLTEAQRQMGAIMRGKL